MRRIVPMLSIALLLILISIGCGEKFDYYEDPTLEETLDIGKGYLRAGDGGNASEAFEAAIKISPTCGEAKYGLLIARNMQFISMIDELLSMVTTMMQRTADAAPTPGINQNIQYETAPLGDYIQDFLKDSAVVWYDSAESLYLDLMTYPDPSFTIDSFSLELQGLLSAQFGGRLGRADLQFFGLLNAVVRSLTNILLAHDLNYDFLSLQIPTLNLNIDLSHLDAEAIEDLLAQLQPIIDLLNDLLTYEDNPDFLYLKGDEGVARMQAAGVDLGLVFWRLHLLIDEAYRATGESSPQTVHYVDLNGDQLGNRLSEPLIIPGIGQLPADIVNGLDVLCDMTSMAFWDHTVLDIDPYRDNPFYLSYANDLLVALDVLPFVIDADVLQSLMDALGLEITVGDDFEIIIPEIPQILGIGLGPWFAEPAPDGVRQILWFIVDLYNTLVDLLPTLLGG